MTIYLDGNLNDFRVQIDGKNVPEEMSIKCEDCLVFIVILC